MLKHIIKKRKINIRDNDIIRNNYKGIRKF